MFRSFSSIVLFLFASFAAAEEQMPDQRYLTNRYVVQDVNVPTLTYWGNDISVELVGDVPHEIAFAEVSRLKFLSEHADIAVRMAGSSEKWFSSKGQVSSDANYVIHFADLSSTKPEKDSLLFLGKDQVDLEESHPNIRTLFEAGLTFYGPACYGSWKVSIDNVARANVIVVDTSEPVKIQLDCLKFSIPFSLGVQPDVTTIGFQFSREQTPDTRPVFIDESEIVLQLRLSAYCRNVLNQNSLECPMQLFGQVLRVHKDLLSIALSPVH